MSEQRDQPKWASKSAEIVQQDKSGKQGTQHLQTRHILWQQVSAEVEARLRQSLHHQVLINLGKEGQLQQVKRSWDYEVKLGDGIQETLDPDLRIADVFDRPAIQGCLLILGNPGSEKTTTLLDLARSLLDRAQEDPLNQWIRGDVGGTSPSQLVICCRMEEYEQIQVQMQLNGAIGLKELLKSISGKALCRGVSHFNVPQPNSVAKPYT